MRRARVFVMAVAMLAMAAAGCSATPDGLLMPAPGGDTTTPLANRNAFGTPAPNLTTVERRAFEVGDSFFTQPWVTAPSSTDARDGLGPLFNATSCSSCHVLDGRAAPPTGPDDPERGLLLRIGVVTDDAADVHPAYGSQIQDRAISGVAPEGSITISYEELPGTFPDGTPFSLRRPTYEVVDTAYGPFGPDSVLSPRIAPAIVGMGLLEAIPEADIVANADPEDQDGDGISGRVNRVASLAADGSTLGRFGWKANVATVEDQVVSAFLGDIGITSPLTPDENCTAVQTSCGASIDGGNPELSPDRLAKVVFYASTLAVPERRGLDDRDVQAGAALFDTLTCSRCHTPYFRTGTHEVAAVSGQDIAPFSDLLLHDMGPGLADGKPDGEATGSEWRTAPLWGIGLVESVNGHTMFLHDGRARSLEEAILWHGGEAQAARDGYVSLDAEDRARVIRFLESL